MVLIFPKVILFFKKELGSSSHFSQIFRSDVSTWNRLMTSVELLK